MEKQNYFSNISKICRVITLVLCFTLLVFNVARPIIVSADAAVGTQTMINIASNYQDVIQVAPYLLPIILLLVAVGWWWEYSEDLADKAMEIYNNGSVALRNWANGIAQEIIDGTSVFKLTKTAATEINKQLGSNNQIPDDKKYIMLPPDLLSLRNADPAEILMSDTLSAIEDGNELLTENNTLISTGNGILGNIQTAISTGIEGVKTKLSSFYTQVGDALTTINNNMMSRLDGLKTTINETKSALANRLDGIKNGVLSLKTEVQTAISEATSSIAYRIDAVTTALGSVTESLGYRIDGVKTAIQNNIQSVATAIDGFKTSVITRVEAVTAGITAVKESLGYRIDDAKAAIQNNIQSAVTTINEFKESLIYRVETVIARLDTLIAKFGSTTADPGQIPPMGNSNDGQQKIPIMIGNSKDLLSKYSAAFLAVGAMLTKFIELPVVGDLVQFSLALGVFALVVNLANQIIAAEDRKGAKSRTTRPAKGG